MNASDAPAAAPHPAVPSPPGPSVHRLFFGEDGLRAGWSVALYLLLVVLVSYATNLSIHAWRKSQHLPTLDMTQMTPGLVLFRDGLGLLDLLIPALIMAAIERRPLARYGLTQRRLLPDLALGLFWGLVNLSLLVGALYAAHALSFDGIFEHGTAALATAAAWFAAFFILGCYEEFLFRGYLQYTVARGVASIVRTINPQSRHAHAIGFWVAAGLFSVGLFMLGHLANSGETASGIIGVGLAGLILVFSLWRTGSLWWAVGWHCAWDWAQTCLFGTADSGTVAARHILSTHPIGAPLLSGGSDGPEGSLLIIPALLLSALIIHLTLPRRSYPLTAAQTPPNA